MMIQSIARCCTVAHVSSVSKPQAAAGHAVMSCRTRRAALLGVGIAGLALVQLAPPADALGFTKDLNKKKVIPVDAYSTNAAGLLYYDLAAGTGNEVKAGQVVTVHFDCNYRGIDVVSSRQARLLGGNRSIAEPFEFRLGAKGPVSAAKRAGDRAGGLFTGGLEQKPPRALYESVTGMRVGGKRTVKVTPELGFGDMGKGEIPPGATFDLVIEVLGAALVSVTD